MFSCASRRYQTTCYAGSQNIVNDQNHPFQKIQVHFCNSSFASLLGIIIESTRLSCHHLNVIINTSTLCNSRNAGTAEDSRPAEVKLGSKGLPPPLPPSSPPPPFEELCVDAALCVDDVVVDVLEAFVFVVEVDSDVDVLAELVWVVEVDDDLLVLMLLLVLPVEVDDALLLICEPVDDAVLLADADDALAVFDDVPVENVV